MIDNEPRHYAFGLESVKSFVNKENAKQLAIALGSMFHCYGINGKFYICTKENGEVGFGFVQEGAYDSGGRFEHYDHVYESFSSREEDEENQPSAYTIPNKD